MSDLDVLFKRRTFVPILRRLSLVDDYPFTGRQIARLEELSPTTVHHALDELVTMGLVTRETVGRAYVFRLNRKHIYWGPIEALLNLKD